jgi:hypothetical protein
MPPASASITPDLLTTKRNDLLSLSNQKQSLEAELSAIISELTAPVILTNDTTTNNNDNDNNNNSNNNTAPPMGINTPLVDNEGYPRSDIDIYRARTLRKRYHEIQTDCKDLDRRMERGLVELTALREAASSSSSAASKSAANNKGTKVQKINEAQEIQARKAPKPKPKYDPITKQWVVKSWDGSIAGVKDGEVRKFEDLSHSTEGALASIAGGSGGRSVGTQEQQDGSNAQQRPSSSSSATTAAEEQRSTTATVSATQQTTIPLTPFAIIDQVFANSPSQEAGILEGDLLLRFGTVTSSAANNGSFTSIKRAIVTELSMAHSNDCSISISVRRSTKMLLGGVAEMIKVETFDLKPRVWDGQGLLGCHLQEYNE